MWTKQFLGKIWNTSTTNTLSLTHGAIAKNSLRYPNSLQAIRSLNNTSNKYYYYNQFNGTSYIGHLSLLILGGIAFSTSAFAQEKEKKPKLTYFNIKGRAEIARLILSETNTTYDYVGIDGAQLKELKELGILAFNQVPLYEEGDLTLVQSHAINRHLARINGLYGKNEKEASLIDQAYEGVIDISSRSIAIFINNKLDEAKQAEEFAVIYKTWFPCFEALLKKNKGGAGFIVGDSLSLADLALFHTLDMAVGRAPTCLDSYPLLKAWKQRIEERPRIKAYVASRYPKSK